MLEGRLADSHVGALIVDLTAGEAAFELVRALRGNGSEPGRDPDRRIAILAFGPHVETELFDGIKAAGADRVMTRGGFDRALPAILQELAAD
jgi:hypothetical protein